MPLGKGCSLFGGHPDMQGHSRDLVQGAKAGAHPGQGTPPHTHTHSPRIASDTLRRRPQQLGVTQLSALLLGTLLFSALPLLVQLPQLLRVPLALLGVSSGSSIRLLRRRTAERCRGGHRRGRRAGSCGCGSCGCSSSISYALRRLCRRLSLPRHP